MFYEIFYFTISMPISFLFIIITIISEYVLTTNLPFNQANIPREKRAWMTKQRFFTKMRLWIRREQKEEEMKDMICI